MPPGQPPAQLMERASAAIQSGQYALAESTLRRALASSPHDWRVNQWLAEALYYQKKFDQAATFARQAVRLNAQSANSNALHALCLMKAGKLVEAKVHCERATELDPTNPMHWNSLGILYMMQENFEKALEPLERAKALSPDDPLISINYARVVGDHARTDEAFAILHRVARVHPNDPDLINLMVARTSYLADFDPCEKLSLARRQAALIEGPAEKPLAPALHRVADVGADRPLRIGLLSHDLRTHSCAFFIRPLLKHLDRSQATLHCFSTSTKFDEVSSEFRDMADSWHNVPEIAPDKLAEAISKERIDVLVELGGYTMGSSVDALVHRPAPLQATAIGYPGTLGMRSITHRLVDSITDTPESDAWYSEKLVRLEGCFLCYDPGENFPVARIITERDTDNPVRFGSFNATVKITSATIDLWAGVLRAVPSSTLLLKGYTLGGAVTPGFLKEEFGKRGIAPERIICKGRVDSGEHHLRLYDSIDIALETVPYNGTTTTCEALMMSVPVFTLAGREHVSRVGASLLTYAGLPELIAHTPDEYVKIASDLANNRQRLFEYHATLRQRVLSSRLCDGVSYAKDWLHAVRATWRSLATSAS